MARSIGHKLVGWPIVGWCALPLVVLTATILGVKGVEEAGWRAVVRAAASAVRLLSPA